MWDNRVRRVPPIELSREHLILPRSGGSDPFRFGVVAPLTNDLPTWRARVRRIAESGYSTLLMPDVPQWQSAPGPTLATAAALTDLRVGTWVYASPLRPA